MSNPRVVAATHTIEIVVHLADHASQQTQDAFERRGHLGPEDIQDLLPNDSGRLYLMLSGIVQQIRREVLTPASGYDIQRIGLVIHFPQSS
jgi:hypothetical protein